MGPSLWSPRKVSLQLENKNSFKNFAPYIKLLNILPSGKVRRHAKVSKPRKLARVEGRFVTQAACNSGTSAVVTRSGELFMFGKENGQHCEPFSGENYTQTFNIT